MLLSLLFAHPLPFTFRWEEVGAMAGAVIVVGAMVRDGISRRWEGWLLLGVYAAVAVGFLLAGNR
jgi:Ca2+/H+ antiporter